jgi:hypothetical protein
MSFFGHGFPSAGLEWIVPILVVGAFCLWGYLRLGRRMAAPVAEMAKPADVNECVREALLHYGRVRGRIWTALAQGTLLVLAYETVILLIGAGLTSFLYLPPLPDNYDRITLQSLIFVLLGWLGQTGPYLLYFGISTGVFIWGVLQFRLLGRIREGIVLNWSKVANEFDLTVGTSGVLSSAVFGGILIGLAGVWVGLCMGVGFELDRYLRGDGRTGAWMGLWLGIGGLWMLSVPLVYLFAIMSVRDAGWLSAAEASLGLTSFRRHPTLQTALYEWMMSLTVFYWPAAMWLLLELVHREMPLLSVWLRERRVEDVRKDLENKASRHPEALMGAYQLLEAGRYLDALNAFQIAYAKDYQYTAALEGIVIAQLRIGNMIKGREAVERLLSLDPSHENAIRIMSEIQRGLWSEGGQLFEQARQRCTQHLGRGVMLRDLIKEKEEKQADPPPEHPPATN